MSTKIPSTYYTITIDDHKENALMIERFLRRPSLWYAGVEEFEAAGQQSELLQMIFLDINLENGRIGLDLLPSLRKNYPKVPVLVFTSNPDADYVTKAFSLGAADFIRKPLLPQEVISRFEIRVAEYGAREDQNRLEFADVRIEKNSRLMQGPLGKVQLTPIELSVLLTLITHKGMIVSKEKIVEQAWAQTLVSDEAFWKKMHELRGRIRSVTATVALKTRKGKGLELCEEET